MDLALAMSLLKQADRCGVEDACLIFTKRTIRSETLDSKKIAHALRHESSCRLAVRVGCGTASAELFQGKAGMPGDSALLERVKNLCQGARLCAAWGSIDDQLEDSKMLIEKSAAALGGKTEHHSRYPGWNYTGSSELADRYVDTAKRLCGVDVEKTALHAGLECGLFSSKLIGLDCISMGPSTHKVHTESEWYSLSSAESFWKLLIKVLEKI